MYKRLKELVGLPRRKSWTTSERVREVNRKIESQIASQLGRYSKSELRRMQKKLKEEIFVRALEELKKDSKESVE